MSAKRHDLICSIIGYGGLTLLLLAEIAAILETLLR